MKIDNIQSAGSAGAVKKKKGQTGGGDFGSLIGGSEDASEPPSTTSVTGVQPLGSLDGLLAAQEVDEALERTKRQIKRSENLLETLDELRHGLLTGHINPHIAQKLATEIRQQRELVKDPKLQEILDEIEVRAEVEKAKLEKP